MTALIKKSFAVIALSLCLTNALYADQYRDGYEAYKQGDYSTAVRLLRPLAEHGDGGAQFILAFMYDFGDGVPQDRVQAYMWYHLAAVNEMSHGNREAAAENRDWVAAKMTPAQISEAQKLAHEWKPSP